MVIGIIGAEAVATASGAGAGAIRTVAVPSPSDMKALSESFLRAGLPILGTTD